MKLTYSEYLKKKDLSFLGGWCLLTGPEQHLKREALGRVRAEAEAVIPGEDPSWEVLDGPSATARAILARGQTMALFGGARVVVVREAHRVKEEEQTALAAAVGPLPEGVAVVLVTGESQDRNRAPDIRKPLRSAIEKQGMVIEFPAMKAQEAIKWATQRAKELGKRMETTAAHRLVQQRAGVGLGELEVELEKLALYVGDRGTITAADVEEVTPKLIEDSIFDMLTAMRERQTGRAVAVLRDLLQDRREKPPGILWRLADAMRTIWQVKALTESGWTQGREQDEETAALLPQDRRKNAIAQLRGSRAWLWPRMQQAAAGFTWLQMARAMQAIYGCDLALKGIKGKINDEEAAVELLLIQLCTGLDMPVWTSPSGERVLG